MNDCFKILEPQKITDTSREARFFSKETHTVQTNRFTEWSCSVQLFKKSMDWFLYDNGLRHERVKGLIPYAENAKESLSAICLSLLLNHAVCQYQRCIQDSRKHLRLGALQQQLATVAKLTLLDVCWSTALTYEPEFFSQLCRHLKEVFELYLL